MRDSQPTCLHMFNKVEVKLNFEIRHTSLSTAKLGLRIPLYSIQSFLFLQTQAFFQQPTGEDR